MWFYTCNKNSNRQTAKGRGKRQMDRDDCPCHRRIKNENVNILRDTFKCASNVIMKKFGCYNRGLINLKCRFLNILNPKLLNVMERPRRLLCAFIGKRFSTTTMNSKFIFESLYDGFSFTVRPTKITIKESFWKCS